MSLTVIINEPGTRVPVSFGVLRDELNWGRYTGPPIPTLLQTLLNRNGGGGATRDGGRGPDDGGGPENGDGGRIGDDNG